MLSWKPEDILAICENEADVEVLAAAGYRTILAPGSDEFGGALPAAEHYIVMANGKSAEIAKGLVGITQWRISVNNLAGYQDLTHVVEQGGMAMVRSIILNSRSMHHAEEHAFADVHKPDSIPAYKTGWPFLHESVRWTFPELVVACGPYAGGKSALMQMMAMDFADVAGRELGATASICAWEDTDWRVRRNIERFAATRETKHPMKGTAWRTSDLLHRVRHITRIPGESRDIGWYLERCELQVKRYNTRFFVFDPWNEHDETLREKNDQETQYVNKMLREMRQFTDVHKVIMAIVTHISAKSYGEEGDIRPFRVAQAHGSSHFGKKADRGFCVARSNKLTRDDDEDGVDEPRMILRVDKNKDEESMGELIDMALKFDRDAMDIELDPVASYRLRKAWRR